MADPTTVRVMTYNVHRCVGVDRVLSPLRIARVITRFNPDVVALQELDVGHARTKRDDQPRIIADHVGMQYFFYPAIEAQNEHYGDAILSRYPMRLVKKGPLPGLPQMPYLERRGALWAELDCKGAIIQILNTHLGLKRLERFRQVEALLGSDWIGHPECKPPLIFCGDFNVWPGTVGYERLKRRLVDAALKAKYGRPRNTFPSRWPWLRIDHVFCSIDFAVTAVAVPASQPVRLASDHLPVLIDMSLP